MSVRDYINEIIDNYRALRKFEEEGLEFEEESPEARLLLEKGYVRWCTTSIGIGSVAEGNYRGTIVIKHLVWTPKGKRFGRLTEILDPFFDITQPNLT